MMETQKNVQLKVIGLAMAAAVGGFLFGFDSSVVNGAVDAIQGRFDLSPTVTGFAVASALLGSAAGAYVAGSFADRYGRRATMLLGANLFLVSALGTGWAFAVWDLVLWRVVGGVGIGIASVVAPAYIAEISPKLIRGRLASLQQLAITLGIFVALLNDTVFAHLAGEASQPWLFNWEAWRWMFLAGAIPALVYGILALRMPESPRYLLQKGHDDQARRVFSSILPAADVDKAVRDIHATILEEAKAKNTSLRGNRFGLLPIVWIGIILSMFQQFVGINVIFYYSTTLWKSVGFPESSSLFISVITSIVNVLVTVVAIVLVDRVGRRPILLVGSLGMATTLGTMALAFSTAQTINGEVTLGGAWGPIALVAANIFVISFGASWGPLVWVLLGEIFPNRVRARALGVAAMAQWISNFLITISFPVLAGFSLPFTYGLYALCAALSFLFVLKKIPETNGLSLEEAETLLVKPAKNREGTLSALTR